MKRTRKKKVKKSNDLPNLIAVGREVICINYPQRKYRRSLTLQKKYTIVEPIKKNFMNTGMQVFVKSDIGKTVGLPFWCFRETAGS